MKVAAILSLLLSSVFAFEPRHYNSRTFVASRTIVGSTRPSSSSSFSLLAASADKNEGTRTTSVLDQKETKLVVPEDDTSTDSVVATVDEECVVEEVREEMTETQKLLQQVKDAGLAGVISYALWELGFWAVSVPVVIFGYYEVVGHFPDLSDKDDLARLGAEAFAFVNFARFAVPLRIGLALSTTPWIESNVVEKYLKKGDNKCEEPVTTDDNGATEQEVEEVIAESPVVKESKRKVPRWRSFLPFGRRKH